MTRRAQGYYSSTSRDDGRTLSEGDSVTCKHCNGIVFLEGVQNPDDIGGFCRMCMANVCAKCNAKGACTPFEKKLEALEAKDRFRRSLG